MDWSASAALGCGPRQHTAGLNNLTLNKPTTSYPRDPDGQGHFSGTDAQPPVGWYNVLRTPQALVDDTAQVFLGRACCAQCHHHPYEKWSQDDYWGLAAFFARVQLANPNAKAPPKAPAKADKNGTRVVVAGEGELTSPHGKIYAKPRPLDGAELTVPAEEDPRQKLVDWMVGEIRSSPVHSEPLLGAFPPGIVEMPGDMHHQLPSNRSA